MRLIDADAIVFTHTIARSIDDGHNWNELCVTKDEIDDIPSAEPERKKGKWIDGMPYVNSHWKVCSECHVSAPDSCGGYKFCPNCGAEMTRGE